MKNIIKNIKNAIVNFFIYIFLIILYILEGATYIFTCFFQYWPLIFSILLVIFAYCANDPVRL